MGRMSSRSKHPARDRSQRQLRVGELIRRTLSDALARGDIHDPDLSDRSITVGEVTVSPDLKWATAHVLPLGGEDSEGTLAALRRNKGQLRHLLSQSLTLKYAPDLRFELDLTFDRLDDVRRIFSDERVRRDLDPPADDDGGGGAA